MTTGPAKAVTATMIPLPLSPNHKPLTTLNKNNPTNLN